MTPQQSVGHIEDNIRSPDALADPHTFFHRLRAHDPVHWSEQSRAWIITSHAEVTDAFLDERLSSDRLSPLEGRMTPEHQTEMRETFHLLRGWMVFADGPVHDRLRDPLRAAFTPGAMKRLVPRVQAIADALLDDLAGRDTCELVDDFAFPIPAIVIAELLGVPPEDREDFKRWSTKLSGLVFGAVESPTRDGAANEAAIEFIDYFTGLIQRYEAAPADNLISRLIAARDSGDALSAEQMVGACTLLLFGGHETTTGLIANGMASLLQHPEQLELLRETPDLAAGAVEECLRYEGAAKVMVRLVLEDHERGGHELHTGDRVYLSLAGASRDPTVFADPDRFDITRDPNPHLGFGHGLHYCLGAPLARMEARTAFLSILKRFPNLQLATDSLQWGSTILGRRVVTLPLRLR